jgi:hypothetical protein
LHETLFHLDYCKNGFILIDYLKSGKKVTHEPPKIQSAYEQSQTEKKSVEGTSHQDLYQSLNEMRKRIADETGIALYMVFSNQAIKNVCDALPANREALLNVSGFGKAKVSKYGNDILELVRDYCDDNNIEPKAILQKKSSRESSSPKPAGKIDTVAETIKLFKVGKTIKEIMAERDLVESTIEGHFAQAIRRGDIKIEVVMPLEEAQKIARYFPPAIANVSLNSVKAKAPANISFGKLKMVLAWIQFREADD